MLTCAVLFSGKKNMKIMPVMANYAKHYASTIYQCLLPGLPPFLSRKHFKWFCGRVLVFYSWGWSGGGWLWKTKILAKFIDNWRSCCFSHILGRDNRFELFISDFEEGGPCFWFFAFRFLLTRPKLLQSLTVLPDRLVLKYFSFLSTAATGAI